MLLAFRVDAARSIGTGHVMRCLALAEALREAGNSCLFICRAFQHHLGEEIARQGHRCEWLPLPPNHCESSEIEGYASWLPGSETDDADEVIACLPSSCRTIVVDHYALGARWEARLRANGIRVIAFDDLVRPHCAELVVDSGLGKTSRDYALTSEGGRLLGGPDYAPLRAEFALLRQAVLVSSERPQSRLLLTMGGMDQPNMTALVLRTLQSAWPAWLSGVDVVMNSRAPHLEEIQELVAEVTAATLHVNTQQMAQLMSKATVAVGAPGATTWERACLGLPSILIPIADNQRQIAEVMQQRDLAIVISPDAVPIKLAAALQRLHEEHAEFRRRNLLLCDGLGVRRLCAEIFPPQAHDRKPIHLRKALASDIEMVYHWQCAPQTRQFARNPTIPIWAEHVSWMQKRLAAPEHFFYIIEHGDDAAGVLRLDRLPIQQAVVSYEISIYIAPDKKRLGLAAAALAMAQQIHRNVVLFATVLADNQASQQLFRRAGFTPLSATQYEFRS